MTNRRKQTIIFDVESRDNKTTITVFAVHSAVYQTAKFAVDLQTQNINKWNKTRTLESS